MIRCLLILLLLLSAPQSPPDLTVQAEDGRVTVRARAVPLKEVLDRLSQETGVEVVYEGPEPSPLITVTIEDQPEREALPRILEGLGLNHALQMDASGRRVEMVIIQEAFGSGPATVAPRGRTTARALQRQGPELGTPDENSFDDPGPDDEYPGGPPAFAEGAPYDEAADPGWTGSPEAGRSDVEGPEFPVDASTPIPPGPVPYPLYPRAASYP